MPPHLAKSPTGTPCFLTAGMLPHLAMQVSELLTKSDATSTEEINTLMEAARANVRNIYGI
jgi:hypothetical protein